MIGVGAIQESASAPSRDRPSLVAATKEEPERRIFPFKNTIKIRQNLKESGAHQGKEKGLSSPERPWLVCWFCHFWKISKNE
jgi:hypothetical protein